MPRAIGAVPATTLPARMKSSTGLALHFMRTGLPRRSGACPVALRGVLNGEGASATTAPKCTKVRFRSDEGRVFLISRGEAHSDRLASSNTPSQWLLFEVSLGSGGRGISTVPCRARCNLAEIYRDSMRRLLLCRSRCRTSPSTLWSRPGLPHGRHPRSGTGLRTRPATTSRPDYQPAGGQEVADSHSLSLHFGAARLRAISTILAF